MGRPQELPSASAWNTLEQLEQMAQKRREKKKNIGRAEGEDEEDPRRSLSGKTRTSHMPADMSASFRRCAWFPNILFGFRIIVGFRI